MFSFEVNGVFSPGPRGTVIALTALIATASPIDGIMIICDLVGIKLKCFQ